MKGSGYNKYDAFFEEETSPEKDVFAQLLSTKKIVERKNHTTQFFSTLSYLLFPFTRNSQAPSSFPKNKIASPTFISYAQMPKFLVEKLETEKEG